MEALVGIAVAVAVGVFATVSGFDRDRSVYPLILMVIASYYVLFSAMDESRALPREAGAFVVFALIATIGFMTNLWMVVFALVAHGLFDWHHHHLIDNAGVPDWWPMFCLSFDVAAAAYLAWRLLWRKIEGADPSDFGRRIQTSVDLELAAAVAAERGGDRSAAFHHLERAHVLGQSSTVQHVRVHWHMLLWGARGRNMHEVIGQALRIAGSIGGTWAGWVPDGNTGGANVGAFTPMEIPADLRAAINSARTPRSDVLTARNSRMQGA